MNRKKFVDFPIRTDSLYPHSLYLPFVFSREGGAGILHQGERRLVGDVARPDDGVVQDRPEDTHAIGVLLIQCIRYLSIYIYIYIHTECFMCDVLCIHVYIYIYTHIYTYT